MTLLLLLKPSLSGVSVVANQAFFNFENDRSYQFQDFENAKFAKIKALNFEKDKMTSLKKSSKLNLRLIKNYRFKKWH